MVSFIGMAASCPIRRPKPFSTTIKPWAGEFDPLSGVVFHEHMEMVPQAAE
jgi:hypothetical protein